MMMSMLHMNRRHHGKARAFGLGKMSGSRDHELDLMTAAVIGVAAGVALTLLVRSGSRKRHPLRARLDAARRGLGHMGLPGMDDARTFGRRAAKQARRGMKRGRKWMEDLPVEEYGEQIRDYLDAAKNAIEDTVNDEIRDFRKTMRRERRRMGI